MECTDLVETGVHGTVERQREIGPVDKVRQEAVDVLRRGRGVERFDERRDAGAIGFHAGHAVRMQDVAINACAPAAP